MTALRREIHELVDQLPDERLAPVLALVRGGWPRAGGLRQP
jgi:hypothetical protein